MRLFSESEIRFYGCIPRRGARPRARDRNGDNQFELDDIRPNSSQGDSWLRDVHREYHRHERAERERDLMRSGPYGDGRFNNGHIEDAVRYMADERSIKINLGEMQMSKTIMNEKEILAVALLDNFTTVMCGYQGGLYTFKKPLNMDLAEEDWVVVALNNGEYRIAQVEEVHEDVQNPDDIKLAWVIQKIDLTQYEQLLEMDKMAVAKIRDMEKRKAKRELLAEFSNGLNSEEQKQLGSDLGIDIESK